MSSKVTNPRCVWCKATASFFYVSDCSSIPLVTCSVAQDSTLPSSSKQTRSEAKHARTRTHKKGTVLFCLAHKHTAKRPDTYSHSSTKQPLIHHPIQALSNHKSMHQFHGHKLIVVFIGLCHQVKDYAYESLGNLQHLNLLKLTSTKYDSKIGHFYQLAIHPIQVLFNHIHAPISWLQIILIFIGTMPLGQQLCMNHLGLQHLNLLQLASTKFDQKIGRFYQLATHPIQVLFNHVHASISWLQIIFIGLCLQVKDYAFTWVYNTLIC